MNTILTFAAVLGLSSAFLRDLQSSTVSKGTNLTGPVFNATSTVCNNATNCGYGYCCGYFYNIGPLQHDHIYAPTSNWTNVTATFSGQCTPSEFNASSW